MPQLVALDPSQVPYPVMIHLIFLSPEPHVTMSPFTLLAAFFVICLSAEAGPIPGDMREFRQGSGFEGALGYLEADLGWEVRGVCYGAGLQSQYELVAGALVHRGTKDAIDFLHIDAVCVLVVREGKRQGVKTNLKGIRS